MEITEVRIKLMEDSGERLQAFCSITFDNCFVVRDLKIIGGTSGSFVAMPSRKLTSHCPSCGYKNHLRAPYCNQCGKRMNDDRAPKDEDGRAKLYADIAHPINSACREMIQERVIREYQEELARSKQPNYSCRYDDFYHDEAPTRHVHTRHDSPVPAPSQPAVVTGNGAPPTPHSNKNGAAAHAGRSAMAAVRPSHNGSRPTGSGFGDGVF